ncbi:Gfo/Idh/MocA family protein [Phycisphaerales bacterium AB-hyl4]|uniref:Gfo/Idh/MocA family protein n=1 Tax=Natronomicrosphaera hydrolytica TaxID=3242702 RepID=A0ABV4UAF5_9BACT
MQLAVIGAGGRACSMLGEFLKAGVEVKAIADPDSFTVKQRLTEAGIAYDHVKFVDNAQTLIDEADDYDGFVIGTRCHLHTPMAIKVAKTGKPLFLEKPVAINPEQLDALSKAWAGRENQVVVSFPLRVTPLFKIVHEVVRSGRLGVINQVQAFNNVPYGGVYFQSWYRRFEMVGGLWLQKATHDFDYLNQIVNARPVRVAAMMTQRVFGTGQSLSCDEASDEELASHIDRHLKAGDEQDISNSEENLGDRGSAFHAAIRNQDAGSAIVWYENGIIVSYDQNFVTRRSAARRGAIVTGYNATLSWDWTPTGRVQIIDHASSRVDTIDCREEGGHGGGDLMLAKRFVRVMKGEPNEEGNLKDGLLSVGMCLAARKASQQHTVEVIPAIGDFPPATSVVNPAYIESA